MSTQRRATLPRGRPFQKGQSGNPGGRPKSLAIAVKDVVAENDLARALRLIVFGPPAERDRFFGERVKVSCADRLRAAQELADRGWGKPTQAVEVTTPEPITVRFVDA